MNNKIREIIDLNNLKVTEVIDNLKVAKSYFYDVMHGITIPSLIMARKFSNELGVPLDELFPEQKFKVKGDKELNEKAEIQELSKDYFKNFSDEAKKDMINNLGIKNNKLRLEILNNNKLINMLKNNGQAKV